MKDIVRDKGKETEIVAPVKDVNHALKVSEAEERIQNSHAGQEALARKNKAREKGESAAYKSRKRVLASMKKFNETVAERDRKSGWKVRTFDNPEALARDCNEYMEFCTANEIIPTWNLFAAWMNCDVQTLYAEESLSTKSSAILKKLRNRIFTILEQFSLQTEGNPASAIFHEKAQYGLSDQRPLDINIHTEDSRRPSGQEIQQLIDLTPEEVHDK